jgi:hypothetical protein
MKKDSIGNPRAGQQPLTHPNELRRLFSKIDTDASGCLDKEELQVGRGAEQACLSLLAAFVQPGLARKVLEADAPVRVPVVLPLQRSDVGRAGGQAHPLQRDLRTRLVISRAPPRPGQERVLGSSQPCPRGD